jgi:hypothetical protein
LRERGTAVTLNGVVSDEFCQKLMVRQVPSRGAGPGAAGVTSRSYFSYIGAISASMSRRSRCA